MRAALISLAFLSSVTYAGGDYRLMKITEFSGSNGIYTMRLVQSDPAPPLMTGCSKFDVRVQSQRVPWFSWLPFVVSNHPSRNETEAAADFLKGASQRKQSVLFGYMGHGLAEGERVCSFLSKGLRLHREGDRLFVLSYHNRT